MRMCRWLPIVLIVCLACLVLPMRARSASWAAAPVSAAVEIAGVGVSLRVAPGPYFLGETVPVTTTVSNDSGGEIAVENDANRGLGVTLSGGSPPYYRAPSVDFSHPAFPNQAVPLYDGQSLLQQTETVLAASGRLVLTADVGLPDVAAVATQVYTGTYTAGRFAGHLPSLTLAVTAATPPDRVLNLAFAGHAQRVAATTGVPRGILYQEYLFCTNRRTNQNGGTGTGPRWVAVPVPIPEPRCFSPTLLTSWYVIVTAPGYAVSTATYCTLDTNDTLPTDQCNHQAANHVAL